MGVYERFFGNGDVREDRLEEHCGAVQAVVNLVEGNKTSAEEVRDRAFWDFFQRAQGLVAGRELAGEMWEAERVMRTVLQFGARPVLEKTCGRSINPQPLVGGLWMPIGPFMGYTLDHAAGALVHEATHLVLGEMIEETFGLSAPEVFVICAMNDPARYPFFFLQEALAYWNQAAWLKSRSSHLDDVMIESAARAQCGGRAELEGFMQDINDLAHCKFSEEPFGQLNTYFAGWRGAWRGKRLPIEEIAPNHFPAFIETHERLGLKTYDYGYNLAPDYVIDPWRGAVLLG